MKTSDVIKILFIFAYFAGGVLLLIGIIKPYPDFPREANILIVESEVKKVGTDNYLFKLGSHQYPLCDKMWVPKEEIIDFLNRNTTRVAILGINQTQTEKAAIITCLKIYSLSINDIDFFSYEDAVIYWDYIALFFRFVALILIIVSLMEARSLKNTFSIKQHQKRS